jgi:peptide-methionine (S)-S-oxide reductase
MAHRAFLAVLLLAPAAVAQQSSNSSSDQAQPSKSPAPKKSTAPKSRSRRTAQSKDVTPDQGASSASAVRKTELATFGAGCFWCVEEAFEHKKGVLSAVSGYSGGNVQYPSYEMVHTGQTGHAECVLVEYDPSVISYEQLLKIFWSCHDPTQLNRQGEDVGPQYRSVIFYHTEDQRKAALKSYEELTKARVFRLPIVTQLVPKQAFFPAEEYHQNYYSGLRRSSARRRKTVVPKSKVVQHKPSSAAKTTEKPHSTTASSKPATSATTQTTIDNSSGTVPR